MLPWLVAQADAVVDACPAEPIATGHVQRFNRIQASTHRHLRYQPDAIVNASKNLLRYS